MARILTLTDGWTLTHSVLNPIPLEKPMPVEQALRAQGVLKAFPTGLEPMTEKWTRFYAWTYAVSFDFPEEEERALLECAHLAGKGEILVNGDTVCAFDTGFLRCDITDGIRQGKNTLALRFEPGDAFCGLTGPVRLFFSTCLTTQRYVLTLEETGLTAHVEVGVHASGKYVFSYAAAADEEDGKAVEFAMRLRAGKATLTHALNLPCGAALYTARLNVARNGAGCLTDFARLIPVPTDALAVCAPHGGDPEAEASLARELGVSYGESDGVALHAQAALCSLSCMERMAGDQKFWPPGGPLWRVGSPTCPDTAQWASAYGENALGDAGRAARLSRFTQAVSLRRDALALRARGARALLADPLRAGFSDYASPALIDPDGVRRPAFYALREAWRDLAVYAELPASFSAKPGESLSVPLWLLSQSGQARAVTLKAGFYDLSGSPLSGASFPAFTGGNARVGVFNIALPSAEGAYIVRAEAVSEAGETLCRHDAVLVSSKQEPLAPLMNLPFAQISKKDAEFINEGSVAALGAASTDGYLALLPGESTQADVLEALNILR